MTLFTKTQTKTKPKLTKLALAVTAALALTIPTAISTSPVYAATQPAQVGLVTFIGAGFDATAKKSSLTVAWAPVKYAKSYEVFASTNYDKVGAKYGKPLATVTGTKATIKNLTPGRDYFVVVRATYQKAPGVTGYGYSSARVGHGTITTQAKIPAGTPKTKVVTWNVCSNACSGISKRMPIINKRISELQPSIVTLQESSRYTTAPSGYAFGYKGQNSILYHTSEYSKVAAAKNKPTSGQSRFASKSAPSGKGVAWVALKNKKSNKYTIVLDAHLIVGSSKGQVAQRAYEASRLNAYANAVAANLTKSHGKVTNWKNAQVVIAGDMNTHKSRKGEKAISNWESTGLYDAYDEAQTLSRQHHNSANPTMTTKPVLGITWGDHVDKVLVKPGKGVVHSWANAGKYAPGHFVGPLGSDHHPVQVVISFKP